MDVQRTLTPTHNVSYARVLCVCEYTIYCMCDSEWPRNRFDSANICNGVSSQSSQAELYGVHNVGSAVFK